MEWGPRLLLNVWTHPSPGYSVLDPFEVLAAFALQAHGKETQGEASSQWPWYGQKKGSEEWENICVGNSNRIYVFFYLHV